MSESINYIPNRIKNAAVGGHVCGAEDVIDDSTGLTLDKVAGGTLEEKEYNSGSNNGMGRVVLRKNLVGGVNTLTQAMMQATNTIYVIQYDFTLGEDITVPKDCVLKFDGGSISASGSNDTITGQDTGIQAGLIKIFSTDTSLEGSWKFDAWRPEWFGAKGDYDVDTDTGTDDYAAINKAIEVAESSNVRKIKFCSNYYVAHSLYINYGGINFEGNTAHCMGDAYHGWNFPFPFYGIYSDCDNVLIINTNAEISGIRFRDLCFTNPYNKNERYDSCCIKFMSEHAGPLGAIHFEYCHFKGYDKVFHAVAGELLYKMGWIYFEYCGMFANNYIVYMDDIPNGSDIGNGRVGTIRSDGFCMKHVSALGNGQIFRGTIERTNLVLDDMDVESPNKYLIPEWNVENPSADAVLHPGQYVFDVILTRDVSAIFNNIYAENLMKKFARIQVDSVNDFNNYPPHVYIKDCMTNGYQVGDSTYANNIIECTGNNTVYVTTDWRDFLVYGDAPIVYDSFTPLNNGKRYIKPQYYWYRFLGKTFNFDAVRLCNQSIPKNENCVQYLKGKTGYEQTFEIFPIRLENVPSLGKQPMTDFTGAKAGNASPNLEYVIDVSESVPDFIRFTTIAFSQYGRMNYNVIISFRDANDTELGTITQYNLATDIIPNEYILAAITVNIAGKKAEYGQNIKSIKAYFNPFNRIRETYFNRTIEKFGNTIVDWFDFGDLVTEPFVYPSETITRLYNGLILSAGDIITSIDSYTQASPDVILCTKGGQVMTRQNETFAFTADGNVIEITSNINYVGEGTVFTSNGSEYKVIQVLRYNDANHPLKFRLNKNITSGTGALVTPQVKVLSQL